MDLATIRSIKSHIKRKGKKHHLHFLYPLSASFTLCLAFYLSSVTFSCLPTPLLSSPISVSSPRCSLPHYIFDSTSSLPFLLLLSSSISLCFHHPSSVFLLPASPPSPFAMTLCSQGSRRKGNKEGGKLDREGTKKKG